MFSRKRLPPDNYPDDYDTALFRSYRPRFKRGLGLWLRSRLSCVGFVLMIIIALGAGFFAALLILPPPDDAVTQITIKPSATPIGDITGDFPADVTQLSITLPAKIDDVLDFGEKHGYRFFAAPGITWLIRVTPDDTLDPLLSLYNPDGTIVQINDDGGGGDGSSQLLFEAESEAQYAILIEGKQSTGSYTLLILPQR